MDKSYKNNSTDALHVFLVVNPVSAFVSRMYIDKNSIQNKDILVCSMRKTDTSLLANKSFELSQNFFERILFKTLKTPILSNKLLNIIRKKNKNFFIYCSWAFHESPNTPSINQILKSELCLGHYYLEEGQLTYKKTKPYDPSHFKESSQRFIDDSEFIFRNDALGFIGILDGAFPEAPKDKRIMLDNFHSLKEIYKPKLIGFTTIGLTCAVRRVKEKNLENMLLTLVNNMPNGGVIKLHPSFNSTKKLRNMIESIFDSIAPKNISLCPNNVFLEIEMLYEKKIIIGSQTSLKKYSEMLGSEFIDLDLY